jgi:hypothetical protein
MNSLLFCKLMDCPLRGERLLYYNKSTEVALCMSKRKQDKNEVSTCLFLIVSGFAREKRLDTDEANNKLKVISALISSGVVNEH